MLIHIMQFLKTVVILVKLLSASDITCDNEKDVCEITLTISSRVAKTASTSPNLIDFPVEFKNDGRLVFRKNAWYANEKLAQEASRFYASDLTDNLTSVVYGDGNDNLEVILVNGEYPGPTIRVPEGKLLAINVINEMVERNTIIHWHGMSQKGSYSAFMNRNNCWPKLEIYLIVLGLFYRLNFQNDQFSAPERFF